MTTDVSGFKYDVFISHSSKDKEVARTLANRLRFDGFQVWFDEESIEPGESIPDRIEDGLEHSRTLLLLMSQNAMASNWVTLERQAALFRSVNEDSRGFIPVRLDDSRVRTMLAHLKYVDYREQSAAQYEEIKKACMAARHQASLRVGRQDGEYWKESGLRQMILDRLGAEFEIDAKPVTVDSRKVVFRARDLALDRHVAIKVPQLPCSQAAQVAASFAERMKLVAELKHTNVIAVYGGLVVEEFPVLLTEFVNGINLKKLVKKTGRQPIHRILHILLSLAKALKYAHEHNSVHHKLRSENILIDDAGNPVITPLRVLGEHDHRRFTNDPEASVEQLLYLSPEQFNLEMVHADKSDQYALGLIGYEMLSGAAFADGQADKLGFKSDFFKKQKRPFLNKECDEKKVRPIYNHLWRHVKKMLQAKPEDRFESLEVAIKKLREERNNYRHVATTGRTGKSLKDAIDSYRRCRRVKGFFKQFYDNLFQRSPTARIIFEQQGAVSRLEEQFWIVREAIELLLYYSVDKDCGELALTKVATSHHKWGLKPKLYDDFVDALVAVAKTNDESLRVQLLKLDKPGQDELEEEFENAWRNAVSDAVTHLKELHRSLDKQPQ